MRKSAIFRVALSPTFTFIHLNGNTTQAIRLHISGNSTRGKDTSPYIRGRIVEARDGGMKVLAIMAKFQVSRAVV